MGYQLEQVKGIIPAGKTTITLYGHRIPYNQLARVINVFGYNSNYNSGVGEVGIYDQVTFYPLIELISGVHYLIPRFNPTNIYLQGAESLYFKLTDCFAADVITFTYQYEIFVGD